MACSLINVDLIRFVSGHRLKNSYGIPYVTLWSLNKKTLQKGGHFVKLDSILFL